MRFLGLLLLSTSVDWTLANLISREPTRAGAKRWVAASVTSMKGIRAKSSSLFRKEPCVTRRPMTRESIMTRYPPRVFGSPSAPSKGAETRSPEGIW
mgnify:CR=1 FL=1